MISDALRNCLNFFCTLSPPVCHFFPPASEILPIFNTDTFHMSLFNHSETLRAKDLKLWENYHHTLCVMCPVSYVKCYMSLVTCHSSGFCFYKVLKLVSWGSVINGVYPSTFFTFFFKTVWYQIFTYLCCIHRFLVIKKPT